MFTIKTRHHFVRIQFSIFINIKQIEQIAQLAFTGIIKIQSKSQLLWCEAIILIEAAISVIMV